MSEELPLLPEDISWEEAQAQLEALDLSDGLPLVPPTMSRYEAMVSGRGSPDESFGYLSVFLILRHLYWKTNRKDQTGYLFGVFFILLFGVRFFAEFVKESQGGFESSLGLLSTGQWLSIPLILIGFYLVLRAQSKAKAA